MNTGGADGRRRDFFISHAGHDLAWAEWVGWHLSEAGYSIGLDCWDWGTGDNFVLKMSEALDSADRVVALLSPAYFEPSRYTADEWSAALVKDEEGRRRLLPLRVAACEVPRLLQPLLSADLFGIGEEEALQRLLAAVRGSGKPDGRPVYPPGTPNTGRRALAGPAPRLPASLPPIWNVQQRNPAFVGRDTVLVKLRNQLLAGGTAVAQALHGMGGVGKTQLAVEYTYRFAGAYELVWWIAAERTELVATQLAALAVEAGAAADTAEIPAAVSALYADLRRRNGWLLIFDNAEDPRALQQWLPGGPGHVLITSRSPNWDEIAAPISVAVFAPEESVTLLRRRVAGISVADAERVASELGNFPLALAQAAGVLGETGLPAAAYVAHLASHASAALAEGTPTSYARSLAVTVSDAADRLADTDLAAAALLRLSAFFGPESIPGSFFTADVKLPAPLAVVAADPVRLHQVLGLISNYGLARLDQAGLQVHRLVQAIVRDRLSAAQRRDNGDCVAALLVAAGPADTDDPAAWPAWASLLPHLLAANPAESDSADLRQLAARALLYLLRRGDSTTAEDLGKALYQRWAERLGADHADTLAAATELAYAYRDRGHLTDTRALIEDTLARRRRVLGDDHPDTLRSASDLAVALQELGQLLLSYQLAEDTLVRRRRVLGEDHPDTLRSATNLSGDLHALGEYQAARQLAEDTLARQRRILGEDHPDTLRSASSLASDLHALGEYQAARELSVDTLARRQRVLGEDHPDTLSSASSLSSVLHALGEYQAARELTEDALARQRRILGEDHPDTLRSATSRSSDLYALGQYQAARELSEDTLARRKRVLGEDHPETLRSAVSLAGDLHALGEYQAARELTEDALARQRRILGEDHPDTLISATNLANDLKGLRQYQAARELIEDTLARQRRILGEDHPDTLRTMFRLGVILFDSGNPFGARKLLERTFAGFKKALGMDHPQTRHAAQTLDHVAATFGGHQRRSKPKARKKGKKL